MQPDLDDVERLCDQHDPDVLYVIHYLGWPQPMAALKRHLPRSGRCCSSKTARCRS